MGFISAFNSVCKFKDENELYHLLEYGKSAMVKAGYRIYPTGQLAVAYTPDNVAIALVKITASITEINFNGEHVTKVEMELVRKLTDEEVKVLTNLGKEMYFKE
jgi:predicted DNA binding protein